MRAFHPSLAAERRYCILALVVAVGVSLLCGCSSHPRAGEEGAPGPNEVWLEHHAFMPASMTVPVGTTVIWINKDRTIHNVTSGVRWTPDGIFASGSLWPNGKFGYTFKKPGTFPYYCTIHSHMEGTIVAQ